MSKIKVGQVFGRLTIIDILDEKYSIKGKTRGVFCLCRCKCGNMKKLPVQNILYKNTRSCGCLRREQAAINIANVPTTKGMKYGKTKARRQDRDRVIFNTILSKTRLNCAVRRKLEFSIGLDDFIVLSKSNCYYCGSEPANTCKYNTGEVVKYSGLDRKDNSLGYTKENAVPCCHICNRAKSDMKTNDFTAWINRLTTHINAMDNRNP